MALPTAYLTSTKRLSEIFDAMRTAKAPERFGQRFLESLGFKSKGDRLIINTLKSLDFLDDGGKPIDKYFKFLDQSQSAVVLAEAIEDAYSDLFEINTNAHSLTKQDIVGKLKTLTQGQYSDPVIAYMASTFLALCSLADFDTPKKVETPIQEKGETSSEPNNTAPPKEAPQAESNLNLGGLVYNIQIVLPESRDPKVYDAIFKSLKEHLK